MRNLKKLLIPVPPMIEEAFGYTGSPRFVAFYWKLVPIGFSWQDPVQTEVSFHWAVWFTFARHRRAHPFLDSYSLGSEDRVAKHWLVLDRVERQFSIGLVRHVKAGYAWWFGEYAPKDKELEALESEARKVKRGLWADLEPLPPWEFRSLLRKGK